MRNVLPPTLLLIAAAAVATLHWLLPVRRVLGFPWTLAGVAPLLAGITLNLLGDASFKKRGTTIQPFQTSAALVTDGVFRLSRHPMYLGMVLILAGLSLLAGSLTPWAVVATFAVLLDVVFIRAEEAMMEQTFGDRYRDYRKRVRRWI